MNPLDFDFHLPQSLIASRPAKERDSSRLLVLLKDGSSEHRLFKDIVEYLSRGDMLLLNRTKVMPVRLQAFKPTGGRLDILLVKGVSDSRWEILCSKKYTGRIKIPNPSGDSAYLEAEIEKGGYLVFPGPREELFMACGMPLPPYIKRLPDREDMERYQTVYAEVEGSIAAPTAGLHFTDGLLDAIRDRGVLIRHLTLHVGKGTFIPIKAESLEGHRMEEEYFEIPPALLREIEETKLRGGRLISVGTTTTRAIEALASGRYAAKEGAAADGLIKGATDIFIYPGYGFRAADCLLTNFHLPRSTPLMLASAFAGRENLLKAYREAIRMGYRFFSYGDAMLIAG
ncbi:MAG: tRNA preQ1(34) S-adenosylmethionine ribosyltransferase-isomerase QueA [Thermodesulfovibrionales bacterium]|nr:tRNA preQ1(34) S-adenosylmethionine ribosyltransferase-isomerase QueA [Thermodesulfovibrionales bacterium]